MKIYFCLDVFSTNRWRREYKDSLSITYAVTERYINEKRNIIVTTSLAHLSFDLFDLGYDIYLCYNDKDIQIVPHMKLDDSNECIDIKRSDNLLSLFRNGVFNNLLYN